MLFIYIGSRIYFKEVDFLTSLVYSGWQVLDIKCLESDLLKSLYYLHSQPPFYNLLIGIVVKISPQYYLVTISILYLILSYCIYIMIFYILNFFNIPKPFSFIFATIYILSPEAILYEHWIFYTWFNTFLILLSLFLLIRYQESKSDIYLLLFFIDITILMLTRSMFHLIFLFGIVAILILFNRVKWKRVLILSLIPASIVATLYMKNYLLFGFFGSSSWMGMNLSKVAKYALIDSDIKTLLSMPYKKKQEKIDAKMDELCKEHKLSLAMCKGEFLPLWLYDKEYQKDLPAQYKGIAVLQNKFKSTNNTNFNHYNYIKISKDMQKDSVKLILNHPMSYIDAVLTSLKNYIKPSWDYDFLQSNYTKIADLISVYELFYTGGVIKKRYGLLSTVTVALMSIFILLYTLYLIYTDKNRAVTAVYMVYIVYFVMIISIMFEVGELNRMRVMSDPLLFVLGCVTIFESIRYIAKMVTR